MELSTFSIPKNTKRLVIAPLGDFQFTGTDNCPTAKDILKRHIDRMLEKGAYFLGLGDYIDFASPSNREALKAARKYETASEVIDNAAVEVMLKMYDEILKPTTGHWIGLVEGHHFYEVAGWTTDEKLAQLLKCPFLGTSAMIKIPQANDLTIYVHHGVGAGQLPGNGLNKLYHVQGTIQGADIYFMGHNTKLAHAPLGRVFPKWGKKSSEHELEHRSVHLVNTGGFSKSLVIGSSQGTIRRGGYAEKGMMTPSPLRAPHVVVYMDTIHEYFNESVWVVS